MIEHQIHFEKKFYRDNSTGYWISTSKKKIRAHVWVWQNHFGKVPKGYHIHHKNEDKSDNQIENLSLISASEHTSMHMQDPERRKKASEMANQYRHLTKEWHASEEGKAWHKAHGILTWICRKPIKVICDVCLLKFETKTYHMRFCSNKCKSQFRRISGLDDEERKCQSCPNIFIVNKYAKKRFCCKKCQYKRQI